MSGPVNNPSSMSLSTPKDMLLTMAPVRKRFIARGYIQQVGYRVFVKMVGNRLGLKGIVRNLPDLSVEILCEGEPEIIQRFLLMINRKGDPSRLLDMDVLSIEDAGPPPPGEYTIFDIDYGRKMTDKDKDTAEREERMILGAYDLNVTMGSVGKAVEVVGQKVDGVGKAVEGVGKDVREVGTAVHNMHQDMNKRFDHMADRYDMIAASLKEAIVHMDRNAEKTDRAIERSRKESASEANLTRKEIARSRKETIVEVRNSQKETAKILSESRKEVAASNRELAGAVKFMIRKLSDRPAGKRAAGKRKR